MNHPGYYDIFLETPRILLFPRYPGCGTCKVHLAEDDETVGRAYPHPFRSLPEKHTKLELLPVAVRILYPDRLGFR
jgi:hypothetical protein